MKKKRYCEVCDGEIGVMTYAAWIAAGCVCSECAAEDEDRHVVGIYDSDNTDY